MADFPRDVYPVKRSMPSWPGGMISVGDSGKVTTRGGYRMGRVWSETYPGLQLSDQIVRAWLAKLNRLWNQGIAFDLQHLSLATNKGLYTGTPANFQIDGANQTGEVLNIKGATASIVGWAKAGDVIKLPGVLANLVVDVIADANS